MTFSLQSATLKVNRKLVSIVLDKECSSSNSHFVMAIEIILLLCDCDLLHL